MRPIDLRDLIFGLLVIIFLAIATGQYWKLEGYARTEAERALNWRHTTLTAQQSKMPKIQVVDEEELE